MPISGHNKYLKISRAYIQSIEKGKLTGRFPSENEIVEKHGVSKATAARVLHHLREEGYILTTVGSGSVVSRKRSRFVLQSDADVERFRTLWPALAPIFARRFPHVDFILDLDRSEKNPDIVTITSQGPFRTVSLLPYGEALLARLAKAPLQRIPHVHRLEEQTVGIPFLVSPTFLLANALHLPEGEAFPTRSSSAELIERLLPSARAAGRSLYDLHLTHLKDPAHFVFDLRKDLEPEGALLPDPHVVASGLRRWIAVRAASDPAADFRKGEATTMISSLMADRSYFEGNGRVRPVISPLRFHGFRFNFLHSLSWGINVQGRQTALAESVVETWFEEEVQSIFAREGFGLPVRKDVTSAHPHAETALRELPWSRGDYFFPRQPLLSVMNHVVRIHASGYLNDEAFLELSKALLEVDGSGLDLSREP